MWWFVKSFGSYLTDNLKKQNKNNISNGKSEEQYSEKCMVILNLMPATQENKFRSKRRESKQKFKCQHVMAVHLRTLHEYFAQP